MNRAEHIAALREEILKKEDLPSIIGELAKLQAEALASLTTPQLVAVQPNDENGDDGRLLTVAQVAERLNEKEQWVRAHQDELPRVQLPGRSIRFNERKLEAWLKRRTT